MDLKCAYRYGTETNYICIISAGTGSDFLKLKSNSSDLKINLKITTV